jgi:XTP/dITP diphosphohydrolase
MTRNRDKWGLSPFKVVLASHNPGKLREIEAILGGSLSLVPQSALAIGEADEPHPTFVENALAKARHASRSAALPALADDSGLCVPALGGEPGVHSAYYAGRAGTREERDARNNAKLLDQLGAQLTEHRAAYYCCVMVLVQRADDPRPLIAEGLWHGEIARAPRGANGFGYDPLFLLPGGKTAAELPPAEKNRLSHRGSALRKLLELLHAPDRA